MRGDIQLAGRRWSTGPAFFSRPQLILETRLQHEVSGLVARAETLAREGYWVVGYISYQAAPGINPRLRVPGESKLPLVWFGAYSSMSREPFDSGMEFGLGEWRPAMSKTEHSDRVKTIKQAIREGITYQVNLTFPMTAPYDGLPQAIFRRALAAQPNCYGALADIGDAQVISVSPELYLSTKGRQVETRPMKGTAPRGRHTVEDLDHAERLRQSEKEQASNVMIVDLLRNDLGRIAEQGSVTVTGLFETERHPTVWQLTSTIEASLRQDVGLRDILFATFPSGSVTGAPKVSTMDLIADHEIAPREVYCGAIGYLSPGFEASEFSVAIRTGVITAGNLTYHVGGGITADSASDVEYEECLWKARVVADQPVVPDLIETMRYHPDRGIPLLSRHLKRLAESAAFWGIPCDLNRVQSALDRVVGAEGAVVRLTLGADGAIEIESRPLPHADEPVGLAVSSVRVDANKPLWFHKTADRSRYPSPEEGLEPLLVNLDGHVTETSISNVMARFGEEWQTPPLTSGCLPGVYRSLVLDEGRAVEATLTLDDLRSADEIAVTNAVRGWRKAVLAD